MILQSYSIYWQDFAAWFLSLPLFYQIVVGVGIGTIVILILIGVYYLLKGIVYLIYYLLKGIYYGIKGLSIGLYRVLKWIYYLIVGKPKPEEKESEITQPIVAQPIPKSTVQDSTEEFESETVRYCPECGVEFTNSMTYQLNKDGYVYCSYCGRKLDNLVSAES
jgi:hypothetical protein